MPECTREQSALQVYYRQLHHPQVAFSIKQKQPATLDEVVAATTEMETYLPSKGVASITKVKQSSETDSVAVAPATVPSKSQHDQKIQQTLNKIIQQLQALETSRTPAVNLTSENITCYSCGRKGHIGCNCRQSHERKLIQPQQRCVDERNLVRPTNYNDSTNCDSKMTVPNYNDDAVFAICAGGSLVEGESIEESKISCGQWGCCYTDEN